jgi:hypothetical protein
MIRRIQFITGKVRKHCEDPIGWIDTPIMCAGLINDICTCAELVDNLMSDAERIIGERLASMLSGAQPGAENAA